MARPGTSAPPGPPVGLLVVGRLRSLTRRRLAELATAMGAKLGRKPDTRTRLVVIAESACGRLMGGALDEPLGRARASGAELISEGEFRRRAGLSPPLADSGHLSTEAMLSLSGLSAEELDWLILFDLVQASPSAGAAPGAGPGQRRFAFRDLVVAREARRLVEAGTDLAQVVAGAIRLRQQTGARLSEIRLEDAVHLTRAWDGGSMELSGQYRLGLDDPGAALPDVMERAEWAEAAGYLHAAERDWRLAQRLDPADPVPSFNLGNVLHELGRDAEAALAWRTALQREPGFAEAWYNLARLAENRGRVEIAEGRYRAALALDPGYADAVYNYALLLQGRDDLGAALRWWRRFTLLAPDDDWADRARTNATLCRMGLLAAERAAPPPVA